MQMYVCRKDLGWRPVFLLLGHVTTDDIVRDLVSVTGSDPVPDPLTTVAEGQDLRTTDEGGPGPVPVLHVVTGTSDVAHVPDLALHMKGGETEGGRGRGRERGNETETVAGIDTGLLERDRCPAALSEPLRESRGECQETVPSS